MCDGLVIKYLYMVSHVSMPEYAGTVCCTPGVSSEAGFEVVENRSAKEPWRMDLDTESFVAVLLGGAMVEKVCAFLDYPR